MKHGIFINFDDTHFLYSRKRIDAHPDEAEIRSLVQKYRGTQVTDFVFCAAGRVATFPSKVYESQLDKYHQTVENGRAVDYRDTLYSVAHEIYEEKGLDLYAILLDEAQKQGFRGWLSIRVNDCHCCQEETSFLHPNFYHEHPEYRRIRHRKPTGYYDYCYDYSCEAVFERELKLVREVLLHYAPDGLELDFQREMFCFQPGHENAQRINELMRKVKQMALEAETACGHKILLSARVLARPEEALEMGFDAAEWADKGYIDVLIPAPRWSTADTDMPIELWKRLLRGTNVKLAPSTEVLIRPHRKAPYLYTDEAHVAAHAALCFSEGADAVYLYNYFDDPDSENRPYYAQKNEQTEMAAVWQNQMRFLRYIGEPETVYPQKRYHMLTFRDLGPMWKANDAALPVSCKAANDAVYLKIPTGFVPETSAVRLRMSVTGEGSYTVFVNSRSVQPLEEETVFRIPHPLKSFALNGYREKAAVIEIVGNEGEITVDFAEIVIAPKEV